MKKILVYGDSNTWGDNFLTNKRIKDKYQWCNILNKRLGRNYHVIQEGLPGRIAGDYEIESPFKNGKQSFMSILRTSCPVDVIIISLGTNDLQLKYNKSYTQIIEDLTWYQETIINLYNEKASRFFNNKPVKIYYIMPVNFDYLENKFDQSCEDKRKKIIEYFKNNKGYNAIIADKTTLSDGIHLDFEGHEYIANLVYNQIKKDNI